MIPESVVTWLEENQWGRVLNVSSLSAGNSTVQEIVTDLNKTIILKQYPFMPVSAADGEAQGLLAMAKTETVRVPEPYFWTEKFLLLEKIENGAPPADFAEQFGRLLAKMHLHTNALFGFEQDNFIGATPQRNSWEQDGFDFFEKHRLRPQFKWAFQKGYFSSDDENRFENVISRMREIVPAQPASLLHGDLWHGNVMADERGFPTLIDPAVHYGWGEAELGMTVMFGGFGDAFFEAYQEVRALEVGWQERLSFYNLYHYLNHLNLFGSGYLGSVRSLLRKFG